jgi:hypothetical protein
LGLDLQALQAEGKLKAVEIEEDKTATDSDSDSLDALKATKEKTNK